MTEKYTELSRFAARCALDHGFYMSFGIIALEYLKERSMPELAESFRRDYCGHEPYLLFALHDSPYADECDRLIPDFPGKEEEFDFNKVYSGANDLGDIIAELMARDDVDHIEILSMPNHGYQPAYDIKAELPAENIKSFLRGNYNLLSDGLKIVIKKQ